MGARLAIQVSDIVWDTDGEPAEDLPQTMSFEVDLPEDEPSESEINEAATDHMSDATGWCVTSFTFDSVAKLEGGPTHGR